MSLGHADFFNLDFGKKVPYTPLWEDVRIRSFPGPILAVGDRREKRHEKGRLAEYIHGKQPSSSQMQSSVFNLQLSKAQSSKSH